VSILSSREDEIDLATMLTAFFIIFGYNADRLFYNYAKKMSLMCRIIYASVSLSDGDEANITSLRALQ
jgi:hypothetical protein